MQNIIIEIQLQIQIHIHTHTNTHTYIHMEHMYMYSILWTGYLTVHDSQGPKGVMHSEVSCPMLVHSSEYSQDHSICCDNTSYCTDRSTKGEVELHLFVTYTLFPLYALPSYARSILRPSPHTLSPHMPLPSYALP